MSALRLVADHDDRSEQQHRQAALGRDRRQHRRHDLEQQELSIDRYDGNSRRIGAARASLGRIVDLSAGGVRIRTTEAMKPDHQVRVRLELPAFAGISPFVDTATGQPRPSRHWVGWMAVSRVQRVGDGGEYEVAGRLVDMEDLDRGMLGLYLSTQPLAA
jgi:hypothetical protein